MISKKSKTVLTTKMIGRPVLLLAESNPFTNRAVLWDRTDQSSKVDRLDLMVRLDLTILWDLKVLKGPKILISHTVLKDLMVLIALVN